MLEQVKQNLKITWNFEDEYLNFLIDSSKMALESLFGVKINFDTDIHLKELLFNRIRYAYNNSLNLFEENFKTEILRLQLQIAIKDKQEQEEAPTEEPPTEEGEELGA